MIAKIAMRALFQMLVPLSANYVDQENIKLDHDRLIACRVQLANIFLEVAIHWITTAQMIADHAMQVPFQRLDPPFVIFAPKDHTNQAPV